jgi:hypothetical protein
MRGYMDLRRTIIWALIQFIASIAAVSFMILRNQGPDSLVWFPWIVGGWFIAGGTACWLAIVTLTHAWIWNHRVIQMNRRRTVNQAYGRSARPDPNRPPVRPMTPTPPAEPIPSRETLERDFAVGVAEAVRDVHGEGNFIPVITGHDNTGTFLPPDPAYATRLEYTGTTGAPPPRNPSPGLAEAIARAQTADNPALTVTQADV